MPYVDTATGARLYYEDTAPEATDKPVIITVHGMLGTSRKSLGPIIDWLADDYRVVAPTMRGYGRSNPKPRHYPRNFYEVDTRDLIAFMDALAIEKAHIMGFSDGGEIALMAGGLAPDRCHSVISWGAVGYFGPKMRDVVTAPNYPERLAPTPSEMTLHGIVDREAFAHEWIDAVLYMIDNGGDVSISTADKITAPLLILLGDKDTLNPAVYAEQYIAKAGHGRLEMFACGHPIHQQQTEAFKQVVGDFLNEVNER